MIHLFIKRKVDKRMDCVVACGNCRGDGCQNQYPKVSVVEVIEEDNEDLNFFYVFNELDY